MGSWDIMPPPGRSRRYARRVARLNRLRSKRKGNPLPCTWTTQNTHREKRELRKRLEGAIWV